MEETGSGTAAGDPVGEVLRRLFEANSGENPRHWTTGECSAVLEALEDAVRPHQPFGGLDGACYIDGAQWPCPTYQQVRDTLEGLL
jgi:hypothetical protein